MKKQSVQWVLGALVVGVFVGGFLQTQSFVQDANAKSEGFEATPAQKLTTRQIASLLDRNHYLNQRLDRAMGLKILTMYFDVLDPNHMLFLQSDVDELTKKYGDSFADRLKQGDLSAGMAVFERYRLRSNEYFEFAKEMLSQDKIDLYTDEEVVLDREKLPRFATLADQKAFWRKQILSQLIDITLGQEDEKAKEQIFLKNPDITKGQDLIRDDKRTPQEILLSRLSRQHGYLQRLQPDEMMETILNTAMQTYDPHSNYYAPVQSTEMQIMSSLQLEGIGVSIRPDRKNPDYTRIVSLVDGGPAAKSGQIKPNDLILAISQDGKMQDVVGWSTREIVRLIRGKRGTNVTIKVKQPNASDSAARLVTLTRDVIEQNESRVRQRVIEVPYEENGKTVQKRIGVLEIPSFYLNFQARRNGDPDYRNVSVDTANALKALNKENIDGLVVDLRNNPGGSLDSVAQMLSLFLKQGPLVQIQDNRGNVVSYVDNKDNGKRLYDGKMVVLVNLVSASASEIFAAAIQDYGRGLIVGNTTTGKGSAQNQIDNLALGTTALTQRKFYRITGGSTQNKGVIPDIKLVNIYDEKLIGERAQKNPLAWDTIKTAPYKPEGKFTADTLKTLNEQSKIRQSQNPQFIYLNTLNEIQNLEDNKKPIKLNLTDRRNHMKLIEQRTLNAENTRRQATGETPYKDWQTYQAAFDAQLEERSRQKDDQRPKLPEEEAFVLEAARLMLDAPDPLTHTDQPAQSKGNKTQETNPIPEQTPKKNPSQPNPNQPSDQPNDQPQQNPV